jgi:hypothetical protein
MTIERNNDLYRDGELVSRETVVLEGDDAERDLAPERIRNAYTTAREWAADAERVVAAWDGMAPAAKDAALQETIRRLGIMLDVIADQILIGGSR